MRYKETVHPRFDPVPGDVRKPDTASLARRSGNRRFTGQAVHSNKIMGLAHSRYVKKLDKAACARMALRRSTDYIPAIDKLGRDIGLRYPYPDGGTQPGAQPQARADGAAHHCCRRG